MKKLFKRILQLKLKAMAKLVLVRHQPKIIAITGSVGKTSTKEAIFAVLGPDHDAARSQGNYNSEIGLPVSILRFKWSLNPLQLLYNFFFAFPAVMLKKYPSTLILEMGADKVGDIDYLTSIAKPYIAVVTNVGPSHLEAFKTLDNTAKEKGRLVHALNQHGFAVLNYEDELVRNMSKLTKAEVQYYGYNSKATVFATEVESTEQGVHFKLNHFGASVPVHLAVLGEHLVDAALAAASCGIIYGMSLVDISKRLGEFKPGSGRLNTTTRPDGTIIIDDTYNSSPVSALAALKTLSSLKKYRKVAVIGDMRELGSYEEEGHKLVAKAALESADKVVFVGANAPVMALVSVGTKKEVFVYPDSKTAARNVDLFVKGGEAVLVKGSRGVKMELIVNALKQK